MKLHLISFAFVLVSLIASACNGVPESVPFVPTVTSSSSAVDNTNTPTPTSTSVDSNSVGVEVAATSTTPQESDSNLELEGLIITPPKEFASDLASLKAIAELPQNLPIFPYLVFDKNEIYLVLSDKFDVLPTEFSFEIDGNETTIGFSSGKVTGTLVRTPLDEIDFGPNWKVSDFGGIIIAETI